MGGAVTGSEYGGSNLDNCVYVVVGARIIGNITAGSNALVTCNAVVNKDVPDNATVGGITTTI